MDVKEIVEKIRSLSRDGNFVVITDTGKGGIYSSFASANALFSGGGILFLLNYGDVKYNRIRLDCYTMGTLEDIAQRTIEAWG